MAEIIERCSALTESYEISATNKDAIAEPGVLLAERRPLSIVHIAGKLEDITFSNAVKRVCSCALPTEPGTFVSSGDLSLIWLAPTRWLAVTPDSGPSVLQDSLREKCGDSGAVIDVSHGRTVIRISGPNARQVLMKGAPLDFHRKVFTPGRAASSSISQCGVLLTCVSDNEFDLYVFRGFGQHMWEWVCDAASEYDYKVVGFISD